MKCQYCLFGFLLCTANSPKRERKHVKGVTSKRIVTKKYLIGKLKATRSGLLTQVTVTICLILRGVATGWTRVDMSTPLLPEVIPEIDTNSVRFFGRRGGGGRSWLGTSLTFTLHFHAIVNDTFSLLTCITITWGLGSLQNTESEANLVHPDAVWHQNLKGFLA